MLGAQIMTLQNYRLIYEEEKKKKKLIIERCYKGKKKEGEKRKRETDKERNM